MTDDVPTQEGAIQQVHLNLPATAAVEVVVQASDKPAPIPLKPEEAVSGDALLHSAHNEVTSAKLEEANDGVINDPSLGAINDTGVSVINDALLAQAATVAQEQMADEIAKSEEDADIVAVASEMVVTGDPTVAITTGDTGSILPSDLSAEVAASAAAVAASLNHEHNDLLLSSEIAQIAAESTGNAAEAATHEQHLASRRQKDRERYASMTKDQREAYNKKRREQYHRQSEESRRKRRERERNRYHSLNVDKAKERNVRRAALERERYKRLTPAELAARNAKRRERAAILRAQKKGTEQGIVLQNIQETHRHDAIQMPSSNSDMELVRVYDSTSLASEISYETLVANTQQVQSANELSSNSDAEEAEESVAV